MIRKRLIKLVPHSKKYIAYNILWQWISLVAQIMAVFSISGLLSVAVSNIMAVRDVIITLIILIFCCIVRFCCERNAAKASCQASSEVKKILRGQIYNKILKLGVSYREKISTSEVTQVCTEGTEQLEVYFGKYLPQLFYSLLAPLTLFAVLCTVSLKSSVVLLICVPLIPVSIVAVQKIAKKLLNRYWNAYTELGDSFLENLQGLTTLKIYQADGMKAGEMDREASYFRKITMKVLTMQLNSTSVMDIVAYGGAAVGMIVAAGEYLAGNLEFADALTIILLSSEFFIPLRLLGSYFHIAMNGMAASDKIFRILDLEESVKGNVSLPEGGLDIKLENVCYSYETDRQILKGISLDIPAGKFVALAGASGCGKSTVASLISGKNRGVDGKITIGRIRAEQISEESLVEKVATVGHNSYLFKGTVEDNLRMAKPDAEKAELEKVLKQVNLLDFLNTQNGIYTQLTEQASNLSGGQRQRLAIARALLLDAPVYIFDEATSNIDAESEEMIMNVIRKLAGEKTVFLISHRLANVKEADQIFLLADGNVAEQGTHEELMDKNGIYRRMFDRQQELEQYGKEGAA